MTHKWSQLGHADKQRRIEEAARRHQQWLSRKSRSSDHPIGG
jgi:hypothetical protein